jgi:hypothetical protein
VYIYATIVVCKSPLAYLTLALGNEKIQFNPLKTQVMKNYYKQPEGKEILRRLLRISVMGIIILLWILIDKGNIYGQSLGTQDRSLSQALDAEVDSPLYKGGDGDPEGDELPTDDEGDDFVTRPNPVEGELVFDFEFTVRTDIPFEVLDPLGRLAAHGTFEQGISSQSIDFSKFRPGMYIVRLDLGDKVKVRRIIKN